MSESILCVVPTCQTLEHAHYAATWEALMTLQEALKLIQHTRAFIGTIYAQEVVMDGKFKTQELEAILFIMRNRPAPPYETAG